MIVIFIIFQQQKEDNMHFTIQSNDSDHLVQHDHFYTVLLALCV